MRKAVLSVSILLLIQTHPAAAGRNVDGAMLLHTNDACSYSAGWDYCGDTGPYSAPLPATCDDLVTTTTKDPDVEAIVWMVAAFAESSSPGVSAYQVGLAGDLTADWFSDWGPCGAALFEIPDDGWPGTGHGTAVAFGEPVYDHLFKIYYFATGAPGVGARISTTNYYAGDHHAEFADDSNPPQVDYCRLFGSVGWGVPGTKLCPGEPVLGACCFLDGHCEVVDETLCDGVFRDPGSGCDPNSCPPPVGACCFTDGSCRDLVESGCTSNGGAWGGFGSTCATQQCDVAPLGACCTDTGCRITNENGCAGDYMGDGTVCDPSPCVTATKHISWGALKGLYR